MDSLFEFTYGLVDFLAVSETKLDSSFPTEQFNLSGLVTPYRKDLSAKSGGLLAYVNSNIPSKKQKWLVIVIYTPPSKRKSYFVTELTKILDKCRGSDENTNLRGL